MTNWAGCEIRRLSQVDSTNREARMWARQGAPHGAAVVAMAQTAGRGRRGRAWASAPGSGLWLSLIVRPRINETEYPLLSLAAALAAADACERAAGVKPMIKWPNDLIFGGRKLCGILVEKEGAAAVIGVGINVRQRAEEFPEELRETACSLDMLSKRPVSLEALETALLAEIERRVDAWDFLGEYAARCATLHRQVRVIEAGGEYTGVAEGLSDAGALIVRDGAGNRRLVLAGDVSVRGGKGYV